MKEAGDDLDKVAPALSDAFHVLRVAAALSHPVVPVGSEMIAEYLSLDNVCFSWEHLHTPMNELRGAGQPLRFLEPRVDFFPKHPSQLDG
jgi:methionyl-tRNA synthetase